VSRSSEVNPELSVALIEESIEVRLKLEYFWKFRNRSSGFDRVMFE